MDNILLIEGGYELSGSVNLSGFKHAIVPILLTSLFISGDVKIYNVPDIEDTRVLIEILILLNVKIQFSNDILTINSSNIKWAPIPHYLSNKVHGTLYLIPCLLGRLGYVELGPTGGCQIGDDSQTRMRPFLHIINILERFGAIFSEVSPYLVRGNCTGFKAAHIDIREYSDRLDVVTGPLVSGATKTAIIAAAIAKGVSVIECPYSKPDVTELLSFLEKSGLLFWKEGNKLIIEGSNSLISLEHYLVSDLIEFITFLSCSVYLNFPLKIDKITTTRLKQGLLPELQYLEQMGLDIIWDDNSAYIKPPLNIRGVDIEVTSQSIYSDNHPFFTLMLLLADRPSFISELVWKNRFDYAYQLVRLGADLKIHPRVVNIFPQRPFKTGICIQASDTRCAATLLIAALGLPGKTAITGAMHLDRGSSNFIQKIQSLGGKVSIADVKEIGKFITS